MFAYSKNRKATQPCRITLSGMGTAMSENISKLTGFDTWLGVDTDSRCYTEIFDKGNRAKQILKQFFSEQQRDDPEQA